jgi:hypothetical protein
MRGNKEDDGFAALVRLGQRLLPARAGTNAVHVEEHIVDRPPLETSQSRMARASKLSRLE